ncbi:MAG: hypothetical protein PHI98_16930 [Eubacteriales bacterium]|nr:hypothetical protein [Eubacteriales bacterium]
MNVAPFHVASYVKLAKLWERDRDAAVTLHNRYFRERFADREGFFLNGVYVEITGKKLIRQRPEMIRLLQACIAGTVNCIATQTRAYLAASPMEFFYLMRFLIDTHIDVITEDAEYNINTIQNEDHQIEAIYETARQFASLKPGDYDKWKQEIMTAIKGADNA